MQHQYPFLTMGQIYAALAYFADHETEDDKLLDRAGELNRILFTRDDDLLREATERLRSGRGFVGVVYAHRLRISIGSCIGDLELISKTCEPQDFSDKVEYLPL